MAVDFESSGKVLRDSCIRIRGLTGQSKSLVDRFVADPSSVAVDGMATKMAGERGTGLSESGQLVE